MKSIGSASGDFNALAVTVDVDLSLVGGHRAELASKPEYTTICTATMFAPARDSFVELFTVPQMVVQNFNLPCCRGHAHIWLRSTWRGRFEKEAFRDHLDGRIEANRGSR
jgi:hypothetical protein